MTKPEMLADALEKYRDRMRPHRSERDAAIDAAYREREKALLKVEAKCAKACDAAHKRFDKAQRPAEAEYYKRLEEIDAMP